MFFLLHFIFVLYLRASFSNEKGKAEILGFLEMAKDDANYLPNIVNDRQNTIQEGIDSVNKLPEFIGKLDKKLDGLNGRDRINQIKQNNIDLLAHYTAISNKLGGILQGNSKYNLPALHTSESSNTASSGEDFGKLVARAVVSARDKDKTAAFNHFDRAHRLRSDELRELNDKRNEIQNEANALLDAFDEAKKDLEDKDNEQNIGDIISRIENLKSVFEDNFDFDGASEDIKKDALNNGGSPAASKNEINIDNSMNNVAKDAKYVNQMRNKALNKLIRKYISVARDYLNKSFSSGSNSLKGNANAIATHYAIVKEYDEVLGSKCTTRSSCDYPEPVVYNLVQSGVFYNHELKQMLNIVKDITKDKNILPRGQNDNSFIKELSPDDIYSGESNSNRALNKISRLLKQKILKSRDNRVANVLSKYKQMITSLKNIDTKSDPKAETLKQLIDNHNELVSELSTSDLYSDLNFEQENIEVYVGTVDSLKTNSELKALSYFKEYLPDYINDVDDFQVNDKGEIATSSIINDNVADYDDVWNRVTDKMVDYIKNNPNMDNRNLIKALDRIKRSILLRKNNNALKSNYNKLYNSKDDLKKSLTEIKQDNTQIQKIDIKLEDVDFGDNFLQEDTTKLLNTPKDQRRAWRIITKNKVSPSQLKNIKNILDNRIKQLKETPEDKRTVEQVMNISELHNGYNNLVSASVLQNDNKYTNPSDNTQETLTPIELPDDIKEVIRAATIILQLNALESAHEIDGSIFPNNGYDSQYNSQFTPAKGFGQYLRELHARELHQQMQQFNEFIDGWNAVFTSLENAGKTTGRYIKKAIKNIKKFVDSKSSTQKNVLPFNRDDKQAVDIATNQENLKEINSESAFEINIDVVTDSRSSNTIISIKFIDSIKEFKEIDNKILPYGDITGKEDEIISPGDVYKDANSMSDVLRGVKGSIKKVLKKNPTKQQIQKIKDGTKHLENTIKTSTNEIASSISKQAGSQNNAKISELRDTIETYNDMVENINTSTKDNIQKVDTKTISNLENQSKTSSGTGRVTKDGIRKKITKGTKNFRGKSTSIDKGNSKPKGPKMNKDTGEEL